MDAIRIGFGHVFHRRLRPVKHAFRYPVFFFCLRLQSLAAIHVPLFGIDRSNLLSFHAEDHGPRDGSPLLPWIQDLLKREGVIADGDIWLQAFPRVLGYVFNPVSFWYCHDRSGGLQAVLAEVSNTFGEHHNYLLVSPAGGAIENGQTLLAKKVFHVSPFMAVDGYYRFRFHEGLSADRSLVCIEHADAEGDLLHTAISGKLQRLNTTAVLKAFLAYPWQSVGVMLRIHWQALRLWVKRVPFFRKPEPPLEETSR